MSKSCSLLVTRKVERKCPRWLRDSSSGCHASVLSLLVTSRRTQLLVEARRAALTGEAARIRKAAGLSQAEVADEVGVTREAIAHWETGRRRPGGLPALRWARLLDDLSPRGGETDPTRP
jgi:DNA-binding transcriptional regulator YiaG